jgi:hypothetical protein
MDALLHDWLSQNCRVKGVLACGIVFPDKTNLSLSCGPDFPTELLEKAWRCVADTYEVAQLHHFSPTSLHWVYPQGHLYSLRRADRITFNAFLKADASAVDIGAVQALFTEFKHLGTDRPPDHQT